MTTLPAASSRVALWLLIAVVAVWLGLNRDHLDPALIESAIHDLGLLAPLGHVELAQSEDFAVQRRHQGGIFPDLPLAAEHLGKTEQRLPGVGAIHQRQRAIELTAQQNHPSLPAPPHQP